MTNVFIESFLIGAEQNLAYAQRLVADLSDEQIIVQPQPGMNHPAWTFSHLNAYHPVIAGMLRGETPEDPAKHRFGAKSKPDADVSLYGSRSAIMDTFAAGHEQIAAALQEGGEAAMQRRMPIERWQSRFPRVGSIMGYLLLAHEATHLGQISAWRRVQGLPAV
jgi:hypothetical protein